MTNLFSIPGNESGGWAAYHQEEQWLFFQIQETREKDILIYSIQGTLDSQTSQDAAKQSEGWLDAGQTKLLGDLSELDYISSSGLGVLIFLAKKLRAVHGKMILYGLRDHVQEVFDISGISHIIPIVKTREEALEAMD